MKQLLISMFLTFYSLFGNVNDKTILHLPKNPINWKEEEIGKPYKGWKEGEMDIHCIYTGRGESNFLILPDGTSMLIDAGDWDPDDLYAQGYTRATYYRMMIALPNSSRRAGEWIARYIKRVNPYKNKVNYFMISHFHEDHMGDYRTNADYAKDLNGDYYALSGITQVGKYIHFKIGIDRGWPNYNYPNPITNTITNKNVANYRKFLAYKIATDSLHMEQFKVGSNSQIKLLKNPKKYEKSFSIRNLCGNGSVWSGKDEGVIHYYDENPKNKEGIQNENTMSLGIRISYGPFRYYAAGDLSGTFLNVEGDKFEIEPIVGKVCGPVDVCKADHHGYKYAMLEGFIKNIQATVYYLPVWDYQHIQPHVMERMASRDLYLGERRIFVTHFPDVLQEKYKRAPWMQSVAKNYGHIVVKVLKGGKEFCVYVLSATDESMIVKAIYGPYLSKKAVDCH